MRLALFLLTIFSLMAQKWDGASANTTWESFGGNKDNTHYSALKQINRENVTKLKVAWTYDTGDAFQGSEMQSGPIIVNGVLYTMTPKLRAIALDAATGKLKWTYDPWQGAMQKGRRNRGVSYWSDGKQSRVFVSAGADLISLYAETGKTDDGFGRNGRIDLREGLGRPVEGMGISNTTPGPVYKDMLIVPTLTGEAHPSALGDIRAYDVRTGKIRWTFHSIPRPGEFGYDTWPPEAWKHTGGANNWAGMVVDHRRGLVFVPTGSAAFDFYGSDRHGDNLFSNTLLCLKADTGERVWHFQAVKHDLWDRDFPTAPVLVTVRHEGKMVDAVAQATKSGHLFLFERETGKSLFPLETRQVPASNVDGEQTAKTQVLPLKPPAFSRQRFTEDLVTNRTPEAHRIVLERLKKLRSEGQFTPPSFEGSIVFPGFDGGAEWGGGAFDPETGLYYVNANEMAWILRLVPARAAQGATTARRVYVSRCAACHREDMQGSPPQFPPLVNLKDKYTEAQVKELIRKGMDRMPAFASLGDNAIGAVTEYLFRKKDVEAVVDKPAKGPTDLKYTIDGYNKFLDPDGYPAVKPPWGTLTAIDLNKGDFRWQIPFGEYPELAAQGMKNTGTENYGGGVVTAGGLVFIGATNHDKKFRAFDKSNGKLLWETTLPASGNSTAATYEVNGKQYVVIGAGGGKSGAASGGTYVAFALTGL